MTGAGPLAFLDLSEFQGIIFFVVRLFLGIVAGFLAWLGSGPLLRLLYRLAFHRPAPSVPLTVGRLAVAILVGVLVFLYFPIGGGGLGWGWGPGSGGGPGAGPGKGGTALGKGEGKEKPGTTFKEPSEKEPAKELLTIALIPSKLYEPGSDRYYLVGGDWPPKTLQEVKKVLEAGKGRWAQLRIVIYANSVSEAAPAVHRLEELAEQLGVSWVRPPEFRKQVKEFKNK